MGRRGGPAQVRFAFLFPWVRKLECVLQEGLGGCPSRRLPAHCPPLLEHNRRQQRYKLDITRKTAKGTLGDQHLSRVRPPRAPGLTSTCRERPPLPCRSCLLWQQERLAPLHRGPWFCQVSLFLLWLSHPQQLSVTEVHLSVLTGTWCPRFHLEVTWPSIGQAPFDFMLLLPGGVQWECWVHRCLVVPRGHLSHLTGHLWWAWPLCLCTSTVQLFTVL